MANITRFDPFSEIARFDPWRESGDLLKAFRLLPRLRDVEIEPQIKLDVTEDEKSYTVKADVPGVSKDDIHVELDGDQVSITAEIRKEKEEKKGETQLCSERYYGRQYRSFSLGHEVDSSKAEAKYQNGVLELKLPKKAGGNGSKELKIQ